MTRTLLSTIVVALIALAALPAPPATAQTRAFVAAQGSDSNPCTFAAPCRTLQRAHDAVSAGSQIEVLDPAGYGTLTITKSIVIEGHGWGEISTTTAHAAAVTIDAGANDHIFLRGLTFDGFDTADHGIRFNSGAVLNIQDCSIRRFWVHGLYFVPTGVSKLSISHTRFASNHIGIHVQPVGAGAMLGVFDHVASEHNDRNGINFWVSNNVSTINAVVSDSIISSNDVSGIEALGGRINVTVRTSVLASNHNFAVSTFDAGTVVRLTKSVITGGGAPFSGGGVTYGDNNVDGNVSDSFPAQALVTR
jgi:hypothetical protein